LRQTKSEADVSRDDAEVEQVAAEMAAQLDPRALDVQSRLGIIGTGFAMQKQARVEALQEKFKELDANVARVALGQETNHKGYKDAFNTMLEMLATENVNREIMDERRAKELSLLESTISQDIRNETEAVQEFNIKLSSETENRFLVLRQQLTKNTRLREEIEQRHAREVAEEVARIQDKIDKERHTSEENRKKIATNIDEETAKVAALVTQESKTREETTPKIVQMMQDLQAKVKKDLEVAASERVDCEENLLKLMEETALNVEKALIENFNDGFDEDDEFRI